MSQSLVQCQLADSSVRFRGAPWLTSFWVYFAPQVSTVGPLNSILQFQADYFSQGRWCAPFLIRVSPPRTHTTTRPGPNRAE